MPYTMQSPPAARTLVNGRWRDYFAGCGYLGLQGHPDLLASAAGALARYGLSTATSRGGFGEHPVYRSVEEAAARFFDAQQAAYFVSGYLGNTVLLQGFQGRYEHVFLDAAAHFSVWDAARSAGVAVDTYAHLEPDDLAAHLRARLRPGERPLVLSDGVFPVSGEIAPVCDLLAVLDRYDGAILCLDDAHATGVLGAHGQGTTEYWSALRSLARPERVFTSHTLSKALGGHGGIIAGDASYIDQLRSHATALTATSPSPIPAAAASAWALDHCREHPELRNRLWANVALARDCLRGLGWDLPDTPVPIICLGARPGLDLAALQSHLFDADICVAHVTRYSSTPAGGALRVAIFADHTPEQIGRLVAGVAAFLGQGGP